MRSPCEHSRGRLAAELAHQRQRVLGLGVVTELVAVLERKASRPRERLDGLDAAAVRARQDAVSGRSREQLHERGGLSRPLLVERPRAIVADPRVRIACGRVADQDEQRLERRRARRGRAPR